MEVPIPSNIELLEERGNLVIRKKWFTPAVIFLLFFCIFWDSFLVFWYFSATKMDNVPLMHILFPLGHVAVGVGLTYFVIAGFINKTDIIISPMQVEVRIHPMKWPGQGIYDISDIKQLYTYQKVRRTKNGTSITYEVRLIDKHNQQKTLIKGLESKDQGLYIEKEIEKIIGVQDAPVAGEV
ncbi:MAG: hypothetical protein AB3N64_05355 [Puniceicoccaceae bacterium]